MAEDMQVVANHLDGIPRALWSICLPQLQQFDARILQVPFGVAAQLNGATATGWFWAYALDDDCLVTTMHLVTHRAFVLHEEPEVDYSVLGLLSSFDTGLVNAMRETRDSLAQPNDPLLGGFAPTLQRNVLAFAMQRGPREFEMPAGSLHDSCNICMLPSFLARMTALLGEGAPCLAEAFARGVDLNGSESLRKVMGSLDPTGATRAGAALQYRAIVYQALAEMASYLQERERGATRMHLKADERIEPAVSAALLASLADPPSLDELAERLYLGRTQLCKRFHRETGKSVGAYLAELRVDEAKRRLERGTESIAEIAHALGYTHASSFSTMFQRHVGVSPNLWRVTHTNA